MTEPTTCPVEECDETVNYTDLIDHLYAQHDAMDLCATVANLVAELEAKVAEYYGTASGIGPGSCDMVREAARDLRDMAAAVPGPRGDTEPWRPIRFCGLAATHPAHLYMHAREAVRCMGSAYLGPDRPPACCGHPQADHGTITGTPAVLCFGCQSAAWHPYTPQNPAADDATAVPDGLRAEINEASNESPSWPELLDRDGDPWRITGYRHNGDEILMPWAGDLPLMLRAEVEARFGPLRPAGKDGTATPNGTDTPGCDCGHEDMGEGWHLSWCAWRRGAKEDRMTEAQAAEAADQPWRTVTDLGLTDPPDCSPADTTQEKP